MVGRYLKLARIDKGKRGPHILRIPSALDYIRRGIGPFTIDGLEAVNPYQSHARNAFKVGLAALLFFPRLNYLIYVPLLAALVLTEFSVQGKCDRLQDTAS
jgi:hypothetical protein